MDLVTAVIAFIVGTLYIFYKNRKIETSLFHSLKIPGPEPHWLTGNLGDLNKKSSLELYPEWEAKYGRTFGYYEGPLPILVTSDPEFIREVFVRQFSKFHDRKPSLLDPDSNTATNMMLARGHTWKRLRTIINPIFSEHKLKPLAPLIQKKIDVLLEKFYEATHGDGVIDISEHFSNLSIDVIGDSAFGMEIDGQNNPHEPLLKASKEITKMGKTSERSLLCRFAAILPEMAPMIAPLLPGLMPYWNNGPWMWLRDAVNNVIEGKKQKQPRQDLLQLMLDAEFPKDEILDENIWGETERQTVERSHRKLTSLEICNQSTLLLTMGDTIGSLMAYVCYLLATNPEKQQTLLDEVDKYKDEPVDEAVQKMQFLDMCIRETLRLFPIGAAHMNRQCTADTWVCGKELKKGTVVQVNATSLHHDLDLWGPVDTKLFHPERFTPESSCGRHDMAWMPFGAGPRICVGVHFALMEAKLTLITLLRHFSFETSPQTDIPLKLVEGFGILPTNDIVLKVVMRD